MTRSRRPARGSLITGGPGTGNRDSGATGDGPDTVDAVTRPSEALGELLVSEDCVEGVTAFAQKRKPHWRNR